MISSIIVPWSGGADSTYLVWWLLDRGYNIYPYYVDYGQWISKAEIQTINKLIDFFKMNNKLEIFKVSFPINSLYVNGKIPYNTKLDENDITTNKLYVPFRNGWCYSLGVAYAESIGIMKIALAIDKSCDIRSDNDVEFSKQFIHMVHYATNIIVMTPIMNIPVEKRREKIIELGLKDIVRVARCNNPHQVKNGDWKQCGKCIECRFF